VIAAIVAAPVASVAITATRAATGWRSGSAAISVTRSAAISVSVSIPVSVSVAISVAVVARASAAVGAVVSSAGWRTIAPVDHVSLGVAWTSVVPVTGLLIEKNVKIKEKLSNGVRYAHVRAARPAKPAMIPGVVPSVPVAPVVAAAVAVIVPMPTRAIMLAAAAACWSW